MNYLKIYAAAFAGFLVIDMLFLGFVARGFYKQHLGNLLAEQPVWSAALVFYLLFVAGLVVFVIVPGIERGSLARTAAMGAFFGLVTYATYDLTNLATIKDWPRIVAAFDMTWGAVLAAAVSAIGFLAGRP